MSKSVDVVVRPLLASGSVAFVAADEDIFRTGINNDDALANLRQELVARDLVIGDIQVLDTPRMAQVNLLKGFKG